MKSKRNLRDSWRRDLRRPKVEHGTSRCDRSGNKGEVAWSRPGWRHWRWPSGGTGWWPSASNPSRPPRAGRCSRAIDASNNNNNNIRQQCRNDNQALGLKKKIEKEHRMKMEEGKRVTRNLPSSRPKSRRRRRRQRLDDREINSQHSWTSHSRTERQHINNVHLMNRLFLSLYSI